MLYIERVPGAVKNVSDEKKSPAGNLSVLQIDKLLTVCKQPLLLCV